MSFFLLALIASAIGSIPFVVVKAFRAAVGFAVLGTLLLWGGMYVSPPDLVNPFWGGVAVVTLALSSFSATLVILAAGHLADKDAVPTFVVTTRVIDEDRAKKREEARYAAEEGRRQKRREMARAKVLAALLPVVIACCLLVRFVASLPVFRASDYSAMLGEAKSRVWTQDVQPKDPNHVRKVPEAYAAWLANKQLGAADSALGSQYELDAEHMTIQMVRSELWFLVPLRFKDWGTWRAKETAPGFIMISAEDPNRPPVSVLDQSYAYMPSAFFGANLKRYLWTHGYSDKKLVDFTFEVDEDRRGWWVVTVAHPTIGWDGDKVDGVVIVNPTDGKFTYHPLGDVPAWVDRVMPQPLMQSYLTWHGKYAAGWLNSWFSEVNLTEPGGMTFVHGSDDEPYFVADITSTNAKDEALLGLMYVSARSGKATYYKVDKGVTSHAVLQAVNGKIAYKKWSGQTPVLYNMYGTMAAIVPLVAENSTYQGVAIVNIVRSQDVAIGADMTEALREYQKLLSTGSDPAPELAMRTRVVKGVVVRFSHDTGTQGSAYYILLRDGKTIFTSGGELSPKLPLTREGDTVTLTYVDSGETVEPLLSFDNSSIQLEGASKRPVEKK